MPATQGIEGLRAELRHALGPVSFAREVLGVNPDPWQGGVLRSDALQMILACSRQSGKSAAAAINGLHTAHYRPGSLVLVISPTQRQSGELRAKAAGFMRRMNPAPELEGESVWPLTTTRPPHLPCTC
jgi:hypothetical protein